MNVGEPARTHGGRASPSVRVARVALLLLGCLTGWVAHLYLAEAISEEGDTAPEALVFAALLPLALGVAMIEVALSASDGHGRARPWRHGAAVLLPAAWLPSAATLPLPLEVSLTALVALAGAMCVLRAVAAGSRVGG